ncbi:RecX family transcriptional regulator [Desulfuribacillus alkaliarsenatis]|uniref:Regulatory protein RecX n=1 Tax=Desulfuribacillus alkaliarsenatis TaxID=766136 RepID=A0A1E5G5Q9_9FIRM|nr:RecX family transcriptional regulator [Desulfuribacillus alkaliarsenatis]OEF98520.1 hypothetical protein BHF68_02325 [Desulfuribacillus alkaliarsenatis]
MAVIATIEQQKKQRERYNIYIETNDEVTFLAGVDQDIIIEYSLKIGTEIDESMLIEIIKQDNIKKGLQKCLRYLAHKMRTCFEITNYLESKEFDAQAIDAIINKLLSYGYINDHEYAMTYTKEQARIGNKGPIYIRNELAAKGITKDIIEQSLLLYNSDLQLENALKFIESKAKSLKNKSAIQTKNTLAQTLLKKGFPIEIINDAIEGNLSILSSSDKQAIQHQGMKAHRRLSKYTGKEYELRMKRHLYNKGFQLDEIEEFMRTITLDNNK